MRIQVAESEVPRDYLEHINSAPVNTFFRIPGNERGEVYLKIAGEGVSWPIFDHLFLYETEYISSFLRMSRMFWGEMDVGCCLAFPNLVTHVGDNYVTVTRRVNGSYITDEHVSEVIARVNNLFVQEIQGEALAVFFNATGNFQT